MSDPDRPSKPPERAANPLPSDPAHAVSGRSAPVGEIGRELGDLDFEPDDLLASLRPFEPDLPSSSEQVDIPPRSSALGAPRVPHLKHTSSPDSDLDEAAEWDTESVADALSSLAQIGTADDPAKNKHLAARTADDPGSRMDLPEQSTDDALREPPPIVELADETSNARQPALPPDILSSAQRPEPERIPDAASDSPHATAEDFEGDEPATRVVPPTGLNDPAAPQRAASAPTVSAPPSVTGPKRPLAPRPLVPRPPAPRPPTPERVSAPPSRAKVVPANSLRTTSPEPATTPGFPSKAPSASPQAPSMRDPIEQRTAETADATELDGPDVAATDDAAILEQLVELPPDRMEALAFESERPASEHLEQAHLTDAFRQLAAVLKREAQARRHPHEQADLAVVYGETLAMLGELDAAREHLPTLVSSPTPATFLLTRQLAFATQDVAAYARAIKAELRGSISPESRRHLMALYGDLLPLTAEAESENRRHLELSSRAFPSDPRFLLKRLAMQFTDRTSGKVRIPNVPDSPQLNEAIADLATLRAGAATNETSKHPGGALINARRAWRQRDLDALLHSLSDFRNIDAFSPAADWLYATWTTYCPPHREAGTALLDGIAEQGDEEAEAALIERRLHGDALSSVEAFSTRTVAQLAPIERLSLGVALGAPHDTLQLLSNAVTPEDATLPLVRAVQGLFCLAPTAAESLDGADLRLAIGQSLGRIGPPDPAADSQEHVGLLGVDLPMLLDRLEQVDHGSPLARALRLCSQIHALDDAALAEAVVEVLPELCGVPPAYLSLLGALLANVAGSTHLERELLARATAQEPHLEAAYQARVTQDRSVDASSALSELAARLEAQPRRTWLELLSHCQSRHNTDGLEHFVRSLAEDDSTFGALSALLLASAVKPSVAGWSRLAQQSRSPEVQAFCAMLATLGQETSWSSQGSPDECLADIAWSSNDPLASALMTGLASPSSTRQGSTTRSPIAAEPALTQWLRVRRLLETLPFALDSVPGDELLACRAYDPTSLFAQVLRHIPTSNSCDAAQFERDLQSADSSTNPTARSEALWALNELDPSAAEGLGSVNVATRVVAKDPRHLPALRLLQRHAVRVNDFGLSRHVAEQLALELEPSETVAHGWLALAASVYDPAPPPPPERIGNELLCALDRAGQLNGTLPLWVLRRCLELARAQRDDDSIVRHAVTLSGSTSRSFDAATLSLRAAEAASRLERWESVGQLLAQAVELCPEHLVALSLRAEFLEIRGEVRHAAEAYDALAEAACMPPHKVAAWLHAADLFSSIPDDPDAAERARLDLEHVVLLDPTHADATRRLKIIYTEGNQPGRLEALLTQLLLRVDDPKERAQLELDRARVLIELKRIDEAQGGLERVLSLFPDEEAALTLAAQLHEQQADYEEAEQKWLRLATVQADAQRQADAYERLATLYETHLEQPARAETAYREVLRRRPDAPAGDQLVQLLLRNENPTEAVELLQQLLTQAADAPLERSRSLQLARLYDERMGDRRRAEEILERTRRKWPNDAATVGALADFYRRGRDFVALGALLDRSLVEARRALASGRFDPGFFELIACVAEQRELTDLVTVTNATLSAIVAQPYLIEGIGLAAAHANFADTLAPDVLSLPLRALLRQTGWALSAAHPVQLRALRATDLTESHPELSASLRSMGDHFAIEDLELYLSPALGVACQAVSSRPAILVVGPDFVALEDHAVRDALAIRALRILSANGTALASTAPVDLWPLLVAYLAAYLPNWQPPGVDRARIAPLRERIERALPTTADPDLATLAADVVASIGNRASQLGIAMQQWGTRTALLALGDPAVILRAVALANGQLDRVSEDPAERQKWIVRNPEARDITTFSVTDAYVEMRAKAFGRR